MDDAPRNGEMKCKRCRKKLHTDEWGRWVDDFLWLACSGDRPHVPELVPA